MFQANSTKTLTQLACAGLWQGFDWSQQDAENPRRLYKLQGHIKSHSQSCPLCPATLACIELSERLDTLAPMVRDWSWHWWLAHKLNQEALEMIEKPKAACIYVMIDFQDLACQLC